MSLAALEFLERSPLWLEAHRANMYSNLSDVDLRAELSNYRKHVLPQRVPPAKGLSVAFTAQQGALPDDAAIKQSVLYFDEVLLPDPVFDLSEWTRERDRMPAESRNLDRVALLSAVMQMIELVPLVRMGRVRFVPSTIILEPPERIPILLPDDSFESMVPAILKDWFRDHARLRKVVVDLAKGQRLVLGVAPDAETSSIMIDFGQKGPLSTYDHLYPVKIDEETRTVWNQLKPPDDQRSMDAWILQSRNSAAGAYLRTVLADVNIAQQLHCSFVTSCTVTGELLDRLGTAKAPRTSTVGPELSLTLPMVATATVEQIAILIQSESAAFDAFRAELRTTAEHLSTIDDIDSRLVESRRATDRLSREQVHEVDRTLREAQRSLKYSLPVTAAILAAGALGSAASGGLAAILAAAFASIAAVGTATDRYRGYQMLPGYFLWKLKRNDSP